MAEYNPSKIIKNGNTYNFRDNTKIPLAGSNAISGDLIPSTDGTVNLGGSSYQWNNAYIKSLTINGAACGDILTHNVSEFVDVTSAQTIGGVKTFSDIPIVVNGKSYVSKINANRTDGTQTGFSAHNGFKIVCNNDSQGWDNTAFAIHIPEYSPTSASVGFKLYDCIEGSTSYKGFLFRKNNNNFQFSPTASNAIDLGTSTNKWKSLNGINPGALSYPNKSSYINIDTTNWDLTCSNQGVMVEYVAEKSGWLLLQIRHGSADIVDLWVVTNSIRINNKSTFNTLDNRNFNMISLPLVEGETLRIFGNASQYVSGRIVDYARIYMGLGNV